MRLPLIYYEAARNICNELNPLYVDEGLPEQIAKIIYQTFTFKDNSPSPLKIEQFEFPFTNEPDGWEGDLINQN